MIIRVLSCGSHQQQLAVLFFSLVATGGCASNKTYKFTYSKEVSAQVIRDADHIAANPEAFIQETLTRCRQIKTYRADFYRQERLGLFSELKPEEHIRATYRAEPHSIRFEFLNPEHDFTEVVYVQGQNKNLMRCRWRRSLLAGAPPPINDYDPASSVTWGKSQSPITEWGIARLMERIVTYKDNAAQKNLPPIIEYVGVTALEKTGTPAHHLQIRYDEKTGYQHRKVDLLIHADSLLPAACYAWLADGKLNASYTYASFELNPPLNDADFIISENPSKNSTPVPK